MPGRNFTDEQEAEIGALYLSGQSARSLARAYGLRFHISIVDALRRQGVTQRTAPERNRLYHYNVHAFDDVNDEHTAYWWGFLYADGCVHRKTLTLGLSVKDMSQVEAFRSFMQSNVPIVTQTKLKVCDNRAVMFTDKAMIDRLKGLGVDTGRPYPERVWSNLPPAMFWHWTRGFFDGDGSARKAPSLVFCGGVPLLEWLRAQFAERCGTNPNLAVTKHSKANISYLFISGIYQALKVTRYIYRDATIYLPRKKAVIDGWAAPKRPEYKSRGSIAASPASVH